MYNTSATYMPSSCEILILLKNNSLFSYVTLLKCMKDVAKKSILEMCCKIMRIANKRIH